MTEDGGDASAKLYNLASISAEQRAVVRDFIRTEVNDFADQTLADIEENLSNKVLRRVTGRLATSMRRRVEDNGDNFNIIFGSNVPYAAIHEFGGRTPPHDIVPKRASVLSFMLGGNRVFAKVVHHPGSTIPARPYIRPAIAENRVKLESGIRESVARMLEGFGRA
jgi:phage gpG-like protein